MSRKLMVAGLATLLALLATLPAKSYVRAEGDEPPAGVPHEAETIVQSQDTENAQLEIQDELLSVDASFENQIIAEVPSVEKIATVLEENQLTLMDDSGQPMNMASQESADLIKSGDPYWYVGATKYATVFNIENCPSGTIPGTTCWASMTPIEEALQIIDDRGYVPTDGLLNVENGNFTDLVVIDGLAGNGNLASLKGLLGLGPTISNLTGSIHVSNMLNGFTLSGFTIEGGVSFENITGNLSLQNLYIHNEAGDGIVIENQNGAVELKNVQSRGNRGNGAFINNNTSTNAPVTIINSAFDNNDDKNSATWNTGLKIITNGVVILEGVAASRNNGSGAEITGFSALTINNSLFDGNNPSPFSAETPTGFGLFADTSKPASVKISNVFAYFNANHGMEINSAGTILMSNVRSSHSSLRFGAIESTGQTVQDRLNEDNKFTGDRWYFSGIKNQELEIALSSQAFDTYLELHDASDDSLLVSNDNNGTSTDSLINFTLNNSGEFYIVVKTLETATGEDGTYTLALNDPTSAHETSSNIKGALLNAAGGNGTIIITNSMFQDNAGDGLEALSLNSIIISTTDISHNGLRGAYLDNCQYDLSISTCLGYGKISITSPSASGWYGGNYFLDNGATGLEVKTKGSITITNTGAYENLGSGMDLRNDYSTGSVTINSNVTNFANIFRNNGSDGLKITSLGTLVVENGEADYNGEYGYYLTTKGLVKLKNLSGSSNGASGLFINNQVTGSVGSVMLSASPGFRNNFDLNGANEQGYIPGVEIRSFGVISLTNLDANQNYAAGAYLTNTEAPIAKPITVLESDTSENQGSGLIIYSKGAVALRGVNSSHNSLTGSNIVFGGETVYERLTNVSSHDTWWFTAEPGSHANIILESTEFNGYLELYDANGTLIAEDDNFYGDNNAQINIDLPFAGDYFIHVRSADMNKGNYALSINDPSHEYKTYFSFFGALISNIEGVGNITLSPTLNVAFNTFDDNNYQGLQINTKGSIIANNLSASDNGDTGAYLSNANGLGVISVLNSDKTTPGLFNNNTQVGLYAVSARTISLRNISADGNGSAGTYINNCLLSDGYCLGLGSVLIKSTNGLMNSFSNNQRYGLWIYSSGNIAITDIKSDCEWLERTLCEKPV